MSTGFCATAASIGWLAIILQYCLIMSGETGTDPVNRTINFFSYFMILTNILVAVAMTASVVKPNSFFDRPSVRTAITAYIVVVAVTYHFILRNLWDPQGWQWLADITLHYVTPIQFTLDWLLFVPKREIPWKTALTVLAFPLVYMSWTLWHGSWSGFYPYPFVDVSLIGFEKAFQNAGAMTLAFLVLTLLLIAIGRILGQFEKQHALAEHAVAE